jgi:hypothetical protein
MASLTRVVLSPEIDLNTKPESQAAANGVWMASAVRTTGEVCGTRQGCHLAPFKVCSTKGAPSIPHLGRSHSAFPDDFEGLSYKRKSHGSARLAFCPKMIIMHPRNPL